MICRRHGSADIDRDARRHSEGARARPVGVFCAARTTPAWLLSKKKSFVATERDTPEHALRRAAYLKFIDGFCPTKLVYIDESFCKTGMRREYGWAPLGERALGKRPFRSWKTLSLIGAIRLGSRPTLMTHEGAVNGRVFLDFIRRRLAPSLRPGDVVIMDNLNIHKMVAVRAAIEAVGAIPIYLPTYSPELNPIELWWADLKHHLRSLGINVQRELGRAVRRLRASLPIHKITAWFEHAIAEGQLK